jgi:hypothetical protein
MVVLIWNAASALKNKAVLNGQILLSMELAFISLGAHHALKPKVA